jgi:hypothetical protein
MAIVTTGARLGAGFKLNHGLMSLGAAVLATGAAVASVQVLGDPGAGVPRAIIPLDAGEEKAAHAPLSEVLVDPAIDAGLHEELDPFDDPALADAPVIDLSDPTSIAAAVGAGQRTAWPPPAAPLPKAPLPGLTQPSPGGPLPIISAKGETPFKAYRRPFADDGKKPRIAVVVGGLGFNAKSTDDAINALPAEVSLSFIPYAPNLQTWIDKARADGHEVLIEIPMEPFDSEANDTGPQTLIAGSDPRDNVARLENLLARGAGYLGVMNYQGAKFAASGPASQPIVKALKERGLGLVGSGVGPRSGLGAEALKASLPFAAADRIVDVRREAEAIDDQLLNLEALALQNGHALGTGFAYPVTIEQIAFWTKGLHERGYVLAPASAVVEARAQKK